MSGIALTVMGNRSLQSSCRSDNAETLFYVGTYTEGKSEGIYLCSLDAVSGSIRLKNVTRGVINPSFLAADHGRRYIYAVNETMEFDGKKGGSVSAFRIVDKTGTLALLNRQPSKGAAPCHLIVDQNDRFAIVSNYAGGNVAVLPISKDGSLQAASDVVRHMGRSVHPARQKGPHAHSARLDASNRFAFVADLGIDKVMIYQFDNERGILTPGAQPWIQVKAGAGPRHFTFHPGGKKAYVINELNSTLTAFAYDPNSGGLRETQTVSTLPAEFSGGNAAADVHAAPSGRCVYGSNRGHDSIVVFAVNDSTGELSLIQHQSTRGKTPRNFSLDPTGRFLLAANQDSDSIVVFASDLETGKLITTGHELNVPAPTCILFVER